MRQETDYATDHEGKTHILLSDSFLLNYRKKYLKKHIDLTNLYFQNSVPMEPNASTCVLMVWVASASILKPLSLNRWEGRWFQGNAMVNAYWWISMVNGSSVAARCYLVTATTQGVAIPTQHQRRFFEIGISSCQCTKSLAQRILLRLIH